MTQLTPVASSGTDAATVADIATRAAAIGDQVQELRDDGTLLLVRRPHDVEFKVIDLEQYSEIPHRKRGHVKVSDAASLIAYVNRHKISGTTLWAVRDTGTIVGVLDDHDQGDEAYAGWGQHRITMALNTTPDWVRWTRNDGRMLSQVDFAELVEDGAGAIVEPAAADMLELAQSFQASREVAFRSGSRLQSGETQLIYDEQIDAVAGKQGQLRIPNMFTLGLSPFEGLDGYKIRARLRWRLNGPKLTLGYKLDRPEEVVRQAFDDVLAAIAERTEIEPFNGTPRE